MDLFQLGQVEELSEIGPEGRVGAKTPSMIENLFIGRSSPDPAEDELSLGIYRI